MILSILASVLMILAIVFLLKLTPNRIAEDLMNMITPNDSLRDKARNLRGNKKNHTVYKKLMGFKSALTVTGKLKQFTVVCCVSLCLFAGGMIFSVLIGNLFLLPVLSVAFALLPFLYTANMLSYYEKQTKDELETTLSIISTSYVRSDDILSAVRENIVYIRPPLRKLFQAFLGDAIAVSSNTVRALLILREKIDEPIFREWCDTLIQCQEDRVLKDTLQSVVAKLTDVRIVNNELRTMLSSVRNEYWMMVALVVGNIPLLYLLNREWFNTLMFQTPGKIVLGICGAVILITALFMQKFTKPITYRR